MIVRTNSQDAHDTDRGRRPDRPAARPSDLVQSRTVTPTDAPHHVALVLGGGGAAGNAWAIGVIAGLAEAGLDMSEAADVVIGTSSGAIAAAQVLSGIPPADLVASVLSPRVQSRGRNRERPPALPVATVFERMRAISAAATSAADLQRAMGAFGLECDSILGPTAGQHRAVVAARSPRHEWPARPMIVVAIDAHTGDLATFDRCRRRPGRRGHRRHRAAGLVPHNQHQPHSLTSTAACAPLKTPTLPRAMRTSWCSRRSADGAGHCPKDSSRACADRRNGGWTWRARSRPCVSRAAASK